MESSNSRDSKEMKEPKRLRISLDSKGLWFLSVFKFEDGTVDIY